MVSSYAIYMFTVLMATLFAGLAQRFSRVSKKGVRVPNKVFWIGSMGILIFVMGFRHYTVGVDDLSYIQGYNIANSMNIIEYYSRYTTEPGFYLLYRLTHLIFGNPQWLFIISATITISLFYKSFSYEIENMSLAIVVFIFATTQYFYYFGIVRMGIATAIVASAFQYIFQGDKKKYIVMIFIASLFHYSAPFALIVLFIKPGFHQKFKKSNLIKLALLIPVAFYSVRLILYPLIDNSRYQGYINSEETISLGFLTTLPIFVFFSFFYNRYSRESKNYQFYYFLFLIKIVSEIFSPIIGIGRMVWYVNISLCFLFPATLRVSKDRYFKLIVLLCTILYSLIYCYYAYFGSSYRGTFMIPYRNILFFNGYL